MIIHQLRRAGERAAMRNGTVMREGAVVRHGDRPPTGRGRASLFPVTAHIQAQDTADTRTQAQGTADAGTQDMSPAQDMIRAYGTAGDPGQLRFSQEVDIEGRHVVSMSGELDIATAEQAYAYISDVIDQGQAPVSVDLGGVTFCDASGLGVLARVAKRARQAGRQLKLTSARPSLLKIMRITGLDSAFPELRTPALAHRLS